MYLQRIIELLYPKSIILIHTEKEFNRLHIIVVHLQEQLPYVGMVRIVLVVVEEEHVHIMEVWQDGYKKMVMRRNKKEYKFDDRPHSFFILRSIHIFVGIPEVLILSLSLAFTFIHLFLYVGQQLSLLWLAPLTYLYYLISLIGISCQFIKRNLFFNRKYKFSYYTSIKGILVSIILYVAYDCLIDKDEKITQLIFILTFVGYVLDLLMLLLSNVLIIMIKILFYIFKDK